MTQLKRYNYKEGEDAIERLRNKISCLISIAYVLKSKKKATLTLDKYDLMLDTTVEDINLLLEDLENESIQIQ